MAKYNISNNLGGTQQAITSTFKTILSVASSATPKRNRVYFIKLGQDAAPAASDNSITFDVARLTAAGTATTITPTKKDDADGAALAACAANHTVEPTITANSTVWIWAGNQRAPFSWFAYSDSDQLVSPATSGSGLALRCRSAGYTGTVIADMSFEE